VNAVEEEIASAIAVAKRAAEFPGWPGCHEWVAWADGWLSGNRDDERALAAAVVAFEGFAAARHETDVDMRIAAMSALSAAWAADHAASGGPDQARRFARNARRWAALLQEEGEVDG